MEIRRADGRQISRKGLLFPSAFVAFPPPSCPPRHLSLPCFRIHLLLISSCLRRDWGGGLKRRGGRVFLSFFFLEQPPSSFPVGVPLFSPPTFPCLSPKEKGVIINSWSHPSSPSYNGTRETALFSPGRRITKNIDRICPSSHYRGCGWQVRGGVGEKERDTPLLHPPPPPLFSRSGAPSTGGTEGAPSPNNDQA